MRDLYARLRNWGDWLRYESDIAPPPTRCVSLESRYQPDAGDVFCDDPPLARLSAPNVADAESMQRMVATLGLMLQYALAVRYAGYPAVMRMRRVGEHAMIKLADNAEIILSDAYKNQGGRERC